eukprot:scaffold1075_cov100-Skeletonema_dohrnii-CCMP3373.AAC.1
MASISEDYLDSLPADERAEFLNGLFSMLSMDPSKKDETMAQNIRKMYAGHEGRVVKCSFCRKDEPDDQEFGECSGCGLALYCSKECQRSDWKLSHKAECGKCEDGERAIMNRKLSSRMDQFHNIYCPLIQKLVLDMFRAFNKEMDAGDVLFPAEFFVDIHLADLPRGTKRPRLYIKHVMLGKLSKRALDLYSRAKPPERGYERVRSCLSYSFGPAENDTISSHHQFHYKTGPDELSRFKRSTKKVYEENVDEHLNMINSIAKGESPKMYKVIKEIMKEKFG